MLNMYYYIYIMKAILILVFYLITISLNAQKYYSYSYDLKGDDRGLNIEVFNNDFFINSYGKYSGVFDNLKILKIDINDPDIYSSNEFSLNNNYFLSSNSQGMIIDSKGNFYIVGAKPINQPTEQLATCTRIKSNNKIDWNIDFPLFPHSNIQSITYISDNSLMICVEEGVFNSFENNRLIWIDSTGTITKEKTLPNDGFKFNEYNYFYMLPDSGFISASTGTPPPGSGAYTYWLHLRKLDKEGNLVWNTKDYMDYDGDVNATTSPTKNGNFIGSKIKDAFYQDSLGNIINNPNVLGLFDNDGNKISEELEPPGDSARMLPNYMFPLKNGDVILIGYSYYNGLPDVGSRGTIARISPNGKFKWWRYIYDSKIMDYGGGSLFDGLELENGDLAFSGVANTNFLGDNIWLLKTDSMGCVTPGCTGYNIVLDPKTSVNNLTEDKEVFFKLYPNPVKTEANISFYNPSHRPKSMIKLIDSQGKILYEKPINDGEELFTIPMLRIDPGNYFIQYSSNGIVLQTEKVVKE